MSSAVIGKGASNVILQVYHGLRIGNESANVPVVPEHLGLIT